MQRLWLIDQLSRTTRLSTIAVAFWVSHVDWALALLLSTPHFHFMFVTAAKSIHFLFADVNPCCMFFCRLRISEIYRKCPRSRRNPAGRVNWIYLRASHQLKYQCRHMTSLYLHHQRQEGRKSQKTPYRNQGNYDIPALSVSELISV